MSNQDEFIAATDGKQFVDDVHSADSLIVLVDVDDGIHDVALNEEVVAMDADFEGNAADARQDERLSLASNEVRDDEDPVFLIPRFAQSYEVADDLYPLQVCTSDSEPNSVTDLFDRPPHRTQNFLRQSPSCPRMPECKETSPLSLNKPTLCRSLAWSQDSMEERRHTKRSRREEPVSSKTGHEEHFSFSGFGQHRRQGSSPTMVHWEEKVLEDVDFVGVIERAATFGTPPDLQE